MYVESEFTSRMFGLIAAPLGVAGTTAASAPENLPVAFYQPPQSGNWTLMGWLVAFCAWARQQPQ